MKKLVIALCLLASSSAFADPSYLGGSDLRLSYSRELKRAHFTVGSAVMNLSSGTTSVLGAGPLAGFEYGLTDRWSMGTNVGFAFQASGKQGAFFFSTVNGTFRYALSGTAMKFTSIVSKKDGESVYVSKPVTQRRVTALIGVDQLFLNGSTSIYPAVGATVGLSYGFGLLEREAELEVRYSSLTANDNPISMIALCANINLDF